jgi:hypothetical protein
MPTGGQPLPNHAAAPKDAMRVPATRDMLWKRLLKVEAISISTQQDVSHTCYILLKKLKALNTTPLALIGGWFGSSKSSLANAALVLSSTSTIRPVVRGHLADMEETWTATWNLTGKPLAFSFTNFFHHLKIEARKS